MQKQVTYPSDMYPNVRGLPGHIVQVDPLITARRRAVCPDEDTASEDAQPDKCHRDDKPKHDEGGGVSVQRVCRAGWSDGDQCRWGDEWDGSEHHINSRNN